MFDITAVVTTNLCTLLDNQLGKLFKLWAVLIKLWYGSTEKELFFFPRHQLSLYPKLY